jgi:hypothetical protein
MLRFYTVRVVSKESRRLVLPRTSYLLPIEFLLKSNHQTNVLNVVSLHFQHNDDIYQPLD